MCGEIRGVIGEIFMRHSLSCWGKHLDPWREVEEINVELRVNYV